ncbi:ankyrin repeat and SAM domain-containing protein 1A isoform X1 [Tachysurus ichikawai]
MSTLPLDLNYVPVTGLEQAEDEFSHSPESSTQDRRQPCGHVKLSRSLSKSDLDFLAPCEENVALGEKNKCKIKFWMERTHTDRLSSLTADWEEIEKIMTLIDSDIELSKEHQPAGKTTPQRDKDSDCLLLRFLLSSKSRTNLKYIEVVELWAVS